MNDKKVKLFLGDRLTIFKEKGFTYNPETGDIFSNTGRLIKGKNSKGYILCNIGTGEKIISVAAHQLAWFLYHNEVPNVIDHIDRNKTNNRIINLRNVNLQINQFNRVCKGYRFHKRDKVWTAHISLNSKQKHLGSFKTEEEARQAYLNAKKIYHKI
jgi:hypothetical protein